MRRPAKITLLVLSHLVLAGFGLVGGLTAGDWHLRENYREVSERYREELVAAGGWPMLARYRDGLVWLMNIDEAQYRHNLLQFDAVLAQGRGSGDPPISRTMYHTYRMLINTRLSQLESLTGDRDKADGYMAQAAENCAMMKWDDCSPETLLAVAGRLDSMSRLWRMRGAVKSGPT